MVKMQIKVLTRVSWIEGWNWVVQSFILFRAKALEWLLFSFILMGISLIVAQLGIFGSLLLPLLFPVFTGGFMEGARQAVHNQPLTPKVLFSGFDRRGAKLVTLGGLYLVCIISLSGYLQMSGLLPTGIYPVAIKPGTAQYQFLISHSNGIIVAALVELAVLLPVSMATLFAPALIMFHEVDVFSALKVSFLACFRNPAALVVYGFFVTLGGVLIILSAGFAIFIVLPLMFLSTYVGYVRLFKMGVEPTRGIG
ncbi:MAG: hypothetical protein KGQ58_01345 [Proteobacteria bacterium]|nr:hypothetical protein [Pseudomonadota bacterium]MDE3208216.1 hypothetical protein [Pseudomonadota bacterium]